MARLLEVENRQLEESLRKRERVNVNQVGEVIIIWKSENFHTIKSKRHNENTVTN